MSVPPACKQCHRPVLDGQRSVEMKSLFGALDVMHVRCYEKLMKEGTPMTDRAWLDDAACAGMDTNLFFPASLTWVSPEAVRACDRCPVVEQCLDDEAHHVQDVDVAGYRGGMGARPRRAELRRRRKAYQQHQQERQPQ